MTDTSSVPPRDNSLPGDWLNSIHQGDCLQVLAQLPDESIDLVVTSPPYNLRNSTGNGSRAWPGYDGYTDDLPHEEYVAWQRQCIDEMLRVLKPTGAIFYNHTWRVQDGRFQGRADILDGFPLRQVIIWHQAGSVNRNPGYFVPDYEVIYLITKPKFRLVNSCTDGAVWRINQEQSGDFPDLPVWPVELPRRAIAATNAQIVLDPFIGSGTTAVAAVLEGRDFIGIEQSARHVEIARQRVAEALNGAVPALPPSPLPADVPEFEHPRFRGSVQVVFDHVQSVLAANGWVPAVLHQANVASDLALSKITVVRAIQALKTAGAIVVHNHGRWSTYALGNGQPQPVISSISAAVTSAMSAHFEPASNPENDVTSAKNAVTSAMSAHFEPASNPENDVTSFEPASNPENDVTSAKNDVTSVIWAQNDVTPSENDVTSTPGLGPGLILLSSRLLKYPGPGAQQLGKNDVTSLNTGDGRISASIAWVDTARVLRQQMPPPQFEEFLAPCAGHSWAGDTLTVAAASAFAVQWLELTLHQDMADQALSTVVGSECSVAYRHLPDVAILGSSIVDDQTSALPTSSAEPDFCPMHEEKHLRRRTRYPSMLRHEKKHGDEIYYCAGENGTCSWVFSAQAGVLLPAGQLQREPGEVQAAYVLKRRGRGL
jgi:site-specific DNA-methyltransferase (adenine-specific)